MSVLNKKEQSMYKLSMTMGEQGYEMSHDNAHWVLLKGLGYSPVQMLVASIGACGGYVLDSILDKMQIKHVMKDIEMNFDVNHDSKAKELTFVSMVFHVQLSGNDHDKTLHALTLVHKYCPVMLSLNEDIKIEKSIQFVNAE
jgi:uncharacterized OsmC-like protein